MSAQKVILVGGGTAGHVEPALAVGRWLTAHNPEIACEFIGTKSGLETRLVPSAGFILHAIRKAPLPRSLNFAALAFPFTFTSSVLQAFRIIRKTDLVIGFGGYVSASAYVAARLAQVPILIHEANVIPGFANKLGAKFANKVAIAFEASRALGGSWSDSELTGMPLRASITESQALNKAQSLAAFELSSSLPTVLVFGGSQGARSINNVIAQTLASATDVQTIHAVGGGVELPPSTATYKALSYVEDMGAAYSAADLIISRSGAVSCAEIACVGRYAVLVPLPIGNGEQEANARELTESAAAEICLNRNFTAEWLDLNLHRLLKRAQEFEVNLPNSIHRGAAEHLGKLALSIMSGAKR